MNTLFDTLFKDNLNALNILSKYSFEFGILAEDGMRSIVVSVLNTDDTTTSITSNLADVMYLTEYGTLTIPAKLILEKILDYYNNRIVLYLNNLVDDIFKDDLNENDIFERLNVIRLNIENYARQYFINTVRNSSTLSILVNIKDENKYLYNLYDLSKNIKCKLIKRE